MPTAIALTERIGSEIRDLDLGRETPDEDIAYVVQTLAERGVVVIRNQKLTIDQFMGFSRRVGPLAIHSLNQFSKPGFPELMVNSNIVENGKPLGLADAGRDWHTDGAYTETPYRSTILYSVEIPVENGKALGDTVFASTSAAYDALGPELRQKVDSLKAVHAHGVARDKRGNAHALEYEQSREMRKGVEHPVAVVQRNHWRGCHLEVLHSTQMGPNGTSWSWREEFFTASMEGKVLCTAAMAA